MPPCCLRQEVLLDSAFTLGHLNLSFAIVQRHHLLDWFPGGSAKMLNPVSHSHASSPAFLPLIALPSYASSLTHLSTAKIYFLSACLQL